MELTREIRDKRVAVMKDVLARLDTERLHVIAGSYLSGGLGHAVDFNDDLQSHLDAIEKNCHVCMLGLAMLSKARLYDGVPVGNMAVDTGEGSLVAGRTQVCSSLRDIFDQATMDLIESVFEQRGTGFVAPYKERVAAADYGRTFFATDHEGRARVIAQIVIDNDGELIVPVGSQP